MRLSKQFRELCESIAVEWRIKTDRHAFNSLPANVLLEALQGQMVMPNSFNVKDYPYIEFLYEKDDWSAMLVHKDPLVILCNPLHSAARHESNMMHEFGHVMLNHPMVGLTKNGLASRDPRLEDEATYLGGCLQIPRLGLLWAIQRNYDIPQIANHFGASEAMVRFRSNVTKVLIPPK